MRKLVWLAAAWLWAGVAAAAQNSGSFFDGPAPAPSVLREGFPRFTPSALPRRTAPLRQAPSIFFNGVELKTFLFSDQAQISSSLSAAIRATRSTLKTALYEINLFDATQALVDAQKRGVAVQVIIDYKHVFPKRSEQLDQLAAAGVEIRVLRGLNQFGIMHNKFALFDGRLLETGSFNWTYAANKVNLENALFRQDPDLLAGFGAYWDWMWRQANPLDDPDRPAPSLPSPPCDAERPLRFKGRAWPAFAFSPNGGTTAELIRAVDLCAKTVDVAMFSFTSKDLGAALLRAKDRGVAVRIVMDKSQAASGFSLAEFFKQNGFDIRIRSGMGSRGVMHNKIMLFDEELLATGSFNLSANAEKNNFENTLFSTQAPDLAGYQDEFQTIYDASVKF